MKYIALRALFACGIVEMTNKRDDGTVEPTPDYNFDDDYGDCDDYDDYDDEYSRRYASIASGMTTDPEYQKVVEAANHHAEDIRESDHARMMTIHTRILELRGAPDSEHAGDLIEFRERFEAMLKAWQASERLRELKQLIDDMLIVLAHPDYEEVMDALVARHVMPDSWTTATIIECFDGTRQVIWPLSAESVAMLTSREELCADNMVVCLRVNIDSVLIVCLDTKKDAIRYHDDTDRGICFDMTMSGDDFVNALVAHIRAMTAKLP